MNGEAKCNCQRCGGHIAFSPETDGQDVTCPHCGKETTLRTSAPESRIRAVSALLVSQQTAGQTACGESIKPAPRPPSSARLGSVLVGVVLVFVVLALLGVIATIWHYSILAQQQENMGNALFGK